MRWIDTHCHLDALEFCESNQPAAPEIRAQAAINGVAHCVIPSVEVANFDAVRRLAHAFHDSYCLGIHPLYVERSRDEDLKLLDAQIALHHADSRLVAVGEIGLDYFVAALCESPLRERQEAFYRAQLHLAKKYQLPVVLHVRRSADRLLKHLRALAQGGWRWSGIAHAFNGSEVQAQEFIRLGFKLGFGGAVTFERALHLRHLATVLPMDALVLETDAPDIPPCWLYTTAQQRLQGATPVRNTPAQLPRIAEVVAALRGMAVDDLAQASTHNACVALPRLQALLV